MFGIKRNWIVTGFVVALCLGLLGAVFLLIPRQPPQLQVGDDDSFRFTPDPHLFLRVDEVSRQATIGGSSVRLTLVASNTAAGDMTIDLRDLRLALVAADGTTLDAVMPVWEGAAPELQPDGSLRATVTLRVPEGVDPEAVLIWKDYSFLRFVPGARGSILCPTLKLDLDAAGVAEPLG